MTIDFLTIADMTQARNTNATVSKESDHTFQTKQDGSNDVTFDHSKK